MNQISRSFILLFFLLNQFIPASGQLLELHITQDAIRTTMFSYTGALGCGSCGGGSDAIGSITDPNGNTSTMDYDEIDQLISTTDALGNVTRKTYDLNRNLSSIIDANGNTTQYRYDPANQLIEEQAADGGITRYAYDLAGKTTSLTDPKNSTTNFNYDGLGRLLSETDPLGNITRYQYDLASNLTQKTTANGQSIIFSYDALNRLTQRRTPEQTYAFTYDSSSRMTGATNSADRLSFSYDIIGNLTQSTVNSATLPADRRTLFTVNLSYAYDLAGRKTSMTDPTGATAYTHDRSNHLTSLTDPQRNQFSLSHDPAGRRTRLNGPNGLIKTYSYDRANRLLELINQANSQTVASFSLQLDPVGNRTRKTGPQGTDTFSYDSNYRLLNSSLNVERFTYDSVGNMTSANAQSQTFNAMNQITTAANRTALQYDRNGNTVQKAVQGGVAWTYVFNSENQLLRATSSDGKIITYEYDALGRRISKTVNGVKTQWIYDGDNILLEYQSGTLAKRYTHGPGIDETWAMTDLAASQSYFYHTDDLGSISAITNSAGSVLETYRYTSFGKPTILDSTSQVIGKSSIGSFYSFTGREWDAETGLCYYRARYYDSNLGRFISADPIGFEGGINIYTYVGNNPINWIDPWGLASEELMSGWAIAAAEPSPIGEIIMVVVSAVVIVETVHDHFNNRSRGKSDPVSGTEPQNPGRDANGGCKPCPPRQVWEAPGDAHGSKCGKHYHWIEWNQNPVTCECFPKRGSGANPPK